MLDLIMSKCKEENFITLMDTEFIMNRPPQVRRISHQFNNRDMALAVERMNPTHVWSYTSLHAANCMLPLLKFELLRVLDMDVGPIVMRQSKSIDLSAINHLFLLRYVKVAGLSLELPKKFGKLEHLMTLDTSGAWFYPSDQASDFTCLSSLRHLEFPLGLRTVAMTNGLSELCNLRTLCRFHAKDNSVECIRDLGELTNLRDLLLSYSRPGDVEDNTDTILTASLDKLGNNNLRSLILNYLGAASAQFWTNCLTRPRHLQRLGLYGLIPKVPTWMAHADRLTYLLTYLYNLEVQELQSDDFCVLARLPCLIYLCLKAQTILEKNIITYPNAFPSLKYFEFYCDLSCLTFEPAAMPRLQKLEMQFDGRSAMQLLEGSLVGGIEHLLALKMSQFLYMLNTVTGPRQKLHGERPSPGTRKVKPYRSVYNLHMYTWFASVVLPRPPKPMMDTTLRSGLESATPSINNIVISSRGPSIPTSLFGSSNIARSLGSIATTLDYEVDSSSILSDSLERSESITPVKALTTISEATMVHVEPLITGTAAGSSTRPPASSAARKKPGHRGHKRCGPWELGSKVPPDPEAAPQHGGWC
ncbi:hypothetical protein U9M48_041643 [Paspalum notatum var. saurae]|uniref:Disease resistance R13L4/SHOC-2-like LRR domain-containing protein n=1 Tax=Paspalum notatum var. saurae TaxID=547442 RepID=A0AAQ3UTL5_PASNO